MLVLDYTESWQGMSAYRGHMHNDVKNWPTGSTLTRPYVSLHRPITVQGGH